MKKTSLKIKREFATATAITNGDLQGRILKSLLAGICILVVCYVFFVSKVVFNIAERKSLEAEARMLANEVSELELVYLQESEKIDLTYSLSMNFKEAFPEYVTRKPLGSIALLKNEI
ncbi:MAG: hypothetical protein K9L98_03440 [Candidatus Pacebacteria bacterium]|nr:hypothetical protein [Candidatus Paceibacterota bacterium]MCF7863032.1 hypothetical protein [Candidatus Paceibacterota bacterium]